MTQLFTILDQDEATDPHPMSELHQTTIDGLVWGIKGNAVLSGCAVSERGAGANGSVDVAAGTIYSLGVAFVFGSTTNVVLEAAHLTLGRIDMIVMDPAGSITYVKGTAATEPKEPAVDYAAGNVLLAKVYRAPGIDTVDTADIGPRQVPISDFYPLKSTLTTNGDMYTRQSGAPARLAVGSAGSLLGVSGGLPAWSAQTYIDHGTITGIADDDHTQYTLLAGRATGQTIYGGTASGDDLTVRSTSHVTRGNIFFGNTAFNTFDEANTRWKFGNATIGSPVGIAHFVDTGDDGVSAIAPASVVFGLGASGALLATARNGINVQFNPDGWVDGSNIWNALRVVHNMPSNANYYGAGATFANYNFAPQTNVNAIGVAAYFQSFGIHASGSWAFGTNTIVGDFLPGGATSGGSLLIGNEIDMDKKVADIFTSNLLTNTAVAIDIVSRQTQPSFYGIRLRPDTAAYGYAGAQGFTWPIDIEVRAHAMRLHRQAAGVTGVGLYALELPSDDSIELWQNTQSLAAIANFMTNNLEFTTKRIGWRVAPAGGFLAPQYARVGSATDPTNTTAGDLTATRLFVNNDSNFQFAIVADNPWHIFDNTDSIAYIRASDYWLFQVGSTEVARISTGGIISAVTGYRINNAAATAGNVLRGNGTNFVASTLAAADIASGAALTKTDDTNVTATLGGSPTTALLAAASITLGWTGTLAVSRGGTGLSSSAYATYTPTVSSSTGTITTASAAGRYRVEGVKVFYHIEGTVTVNGTGAGILRATLPGGITAQADNKYIGAGRNLTNGNQLQLVISNSVGFQILNYDNTYPIAADPTSFAIDGVFESA